MLSISVSPSYPDISIEPLVLTRDLADLVSVHKQNFYDNAWTEQPTAESLAEDYKILMKYPVYNAYRVSCQAKFLFLLELTPMSHTSFDDLYDQLPGDYLIQVSVIALQEYVDARTRTLRACLEAIFRHQEIRRVIIPVYYNLPANPLRLLLEAAGFSILQENEGARSPAIYGYPVKSTG